MTYFNMLNGIMDGVQGVLAFIPKFLYMIIALIGSLLDLCQLALRKIAGVDPIFINNKAGSGDPAYRIIINAIFGEGNPYPAIRILFWGFIVLGVIMLFVTAFISLLQAEFALDRAKAEKKMNNTKFYAILSIVKALFALLIVPVASLFGMFMATGLLQSVDQLTANAGYSVGGDVDYRNYFDSYKNVKSGGILGGLITSNELQTNGVYSAFTIFGTDIPTTSTPLSGLIFKNSAYSCNRIRMYDKYYENVIVGIKDSGGETTNLGFLDEVGSAEVAANLLDLGFSINAKLKNPVNLKDNDIPNKYYADYTIDAAFFHGISTVKTLNRYNASLVFYYYNLWDFNYIVGFLAVFTITKTFYSFTLVLMQRLFEVLVLFLISPLATGMHPIDNGEALGKWRKKFIPKFIMIIIMIGLINLIFPIMSIFSTIRFVDNVFVDTLLQTFLMIATITGVERAMGILGEIFGAEEDLANLSSRSSAITEGFKSGLSTTFKGVKAAALPLKVAGKPIATGVSKWAKTSNSKFARGLRATGSGFKKVGGAIGKGLSFVGFDRASGKTVNNFAKNMGENFGFIESDEEKKKKEEAKKKKDKK